MKNKITYESYSYDGVTNINDYDDTPKFNTSFLTFRNIIFILVSILVIFSLYRLTAGKEVLSFTSAIQNLSNLPNVTIPTFQNLIIEGSWGLLDFFRVTLNLFIMIANVLLFFANGVLQLIQILYSFLGWLL